jgi:rhodanese-related sulfurtransferase
MNVTLRMLGCSLLLVAVAPAIADTPPPTPAPATTTAAISRAVPTVDQATLLARLAQQGPDLLVLDVRTAEEYAAGHVPGARNIAHDLLPARLAELADARDRDVVVYCRSGRRSAIALETLRAAGFSRVAQLEGDFLAWEAAQRPVEKPAAAAAPPVQP